MAPFTRDDLQLIRANITAKGAVRDLAILNLGIDSMLRVSDLVRLKVSDVRDATGKIVASFPICQMKTGEPVDCALTKGSKEALERLIDAENKWADDYLFTAHNKPHGRHITQWMVRVLVKRWATYAHKDPARYSNHSLRRTKAAFLYAETKNIEAIATLLGHTSLQQTRVYLGVTKSDALALAHRYEI